MQTGFQEIKKKVAHGRYHLKRKFTGELSLLLHGYFEFSGYSEAEPRDSLETSELWRAHTLLPVVYPIYTTLIARAWQIFNFVAIGKKSVGYL